MSFRTHSNAQDDDDDEEEEEEEEEIGRGTVRETRLGDRSPWSFFSRRPGGGGKWRGGGTSRGGWLANATIDERTRRAPS
jgi:hypothetical protein